MARKIFAVVALFVVCYLGAHFYIRHKNTVTDDVTKVGRLASCQPNDARAITIEQRVEGKPVELRFERVDRPPPGVPSVTAVERWIWVMRTPVAGVADPATVRRIVSTMCGLYDPRDVRADEFRPETATRRLAHRVEITFENGKTSSVEFGALADSATVVHYAGPEGERTVRIPQDFLQVTSRPTGEYKNLRVMRLDADNIQQTTLSIDGKERFTLERAGSDWKVLNDGKMLGQGSDEAGKFLNRVSTLLAIGVVSEDFPDERCAAIPTKVKVSLLDISGRQEVVRFAYGPAGDVLACSSMGAQEFKVHRDMVPYLEITPKSILKK
jgi:hypothetical protein